MMDSLYEKYMHERQGAFVLRKPDAFITYKILGPECFIVDMFIEKESRSTGRFKQYLDELSEIALGKSCQIITANIHLADPGANHSLRSALKYGFKVSQSGANVLLISKELNRG